MFCADASTGILTAHPYLKGEQVADIEGKKGYPLRKELLRSASDTSCPAPRGERDARTIGAADSLRDRVRAADPERIRSRACMTGAHMKGRRQFLGDATSNIAAMAALGAVPPRTPSPNGDEWDLAWPTRLTGTHRALFDGAEIESGAAEARQEAVGALVPGVILQPSGVLAAYLAQKHGCAYLHAS